jgi:hypothetical protein
MRRFRLVLACSVPLLTSSLFAQKGEVYGDYTYMQFNPTVTGLQSRALNGAGGGVQWNMSKYLGVKMDLQGYMSTEWTLNVKSPIPVNGGVIPVGTYKSNSTMFTYLFGPVIRVPAKRVVVFGELLFGGSNTNLYGSLYTANIVGGQSSEKSGAQHPFTMAFGGGFDVVLNKNVALRLGEFDYVLTRYTNPITDTNNQNHFRYLGGVVFRWGGE